MSGARDLPRVLVVDDAAEMRTVICRILTDNGYRADAVGSVAAARAMGPAGYDVVLADARLGRERGADLVRELVAADPGMAGRCLMITGGDLDGIPDGIPCLAKPFRPGALVDAVRALRDADRAAAPPLVPAQARPAGTGREGTGREGPARAAGVQPLAAGQPQAEALLSIARMLRARERADLADFLHDGPIQELSAAILGLRLVRGRLAAGQPDQLDEVVKQVDAAALAMRSLIDSRGAWHGETRLADALTERTGWLLASPAVVDVHPSLPEPGGPRASLIADIAEMMLFLLTAGGPPLSAQVSVRPADEAVRIDVAVTTAAGGTRPGDAIEVLGTRLRVLADALAAAVRLQAGAGFLRAQLTLPPG